MQVVLQEWRRWRYKDKFCVMRNIQNQISGCKMTQQERIKELSGYLGMSLNAIAKEAGLSPQKFYDIMSGRSGITEIFAHKVCNRFREISLPWLMTGSGSMIDDTPKRSAQEEHDMREENSMLRSQVESLIRMNTSLAETNRMLTQMLSGISESETVVKKSM